MYCQNCGTQLPDGTAVCHQCGNPPLRMPVAMSTSIESDPGMRMLLPVGRSVWAVLAGYAGLFAVLGVCAPFALILGIIALVDLKRHPEKYGRGRAIFAIVMGTIFSLIVVFIVIAIAYEEASRH